MLNVKKPDVLNKSKKKKEKTFLKIIFHNKQHFKKNLFVHDIQPP